ncbi:hypothetical protein ARTSIC4J27_253 [Pseudarthrobacter siccitolerans]|uniref:Uncharacterized protein n=1 Tax=Pseudarthrobacter siccitolerans TaxID=861266 RepID=A0A024GXV6_9MICC|nr:hypothetical protein [Pseudarthrobacter siccitolerans]CCQ44329.1 hypothetical protein ARTSIC4J27_253 [Pseudarthrobacter siccitolerans]
MFTPQIPLDAYLTVLSSASPEDHPWSSEEYEMTAEARAELGEGFTKLAHGMVAFVTAATKHQDYESARAVLEDMVHTFPVQEDGNVPGQEDPFAALLALLSEHGGEPADPALIDDEGNVNPDTLPVEK